MEAQQIKSVIERALVSYSGTSTSDGAAGGTTVVCSALTGQPDYDGQTIMITEGTYAGQARDIDGATTGGTVTVTPGFGGQIVSGINFVILSGVPATKELDDVMGTGFDTGTDSLVKIHDDHVTHLTADYGATEKAAIDLLDDAGYGLAALDTELGLIPQSGGTTTWNATALASINAEVDTALNTAIPGVPTANSINERIATLDDNYTATRAGYLDNINQAGLLQVTAARAALLDQITALRLAELDAANLPANIDAILADTGTDGVVVNSRTAAFKRLAGVPQVIEVSITAAANAGLTTVATITTQPCVIGSIVIHADAAQTADMTTCAVKGGASQVVTFISTTDATQANLNAADKQVSWVGAVRLAATKTIVIDLQGTGVTAVDLTISVTYHAAVDGGYLA